MLQLLHDPVAVGFLLRNDRQDRQLGNTFAQLRFPGIQGVPSHDAATSYCIVLNAASDVNIEYKHDFRLGLLQRHISVDVAPVFQECDQIGHLVDGDIFLQPDRHQRLAGAAKFVDVVPQHDFDFPFRLL